MFKSSFTLSIDSVVVRGSGASISEETKLQADNAAESGFLTSAMKGQSERINRESTNIINKHIYNESLPWAMKSFISRSRLAVVFALSKSKVAFSDSAACKI